MTAAEFVRFWIDQAVRFFVLPATAVEWAAVLAIALLAAVAPAPVGLLKRAAEWLRGLAERRTLAIVICGVLPVALRLALLGLYPAPEPSIHDEFSHLLLADTLAHGHLSNPPHPLWRHFESIHIIQQPTYSSMYPPGQALFLAAGQVVLHEPWAGVLLMVGLMFAAMCWMMQQWLPPATAFYGTLLAIARIGFVGPWIDSYLGGAVSALGGALVAGAVPRLRETPLRARYYILFCGGLVILMNSRPFEGAIFGLASLLFVLPAQWRALRTGLPVRALVPGIALLILGVLFTGIYSRGVTGSALRMPYMVNRDTYGWPENLAFLPVHAVRSPHKVLRDMYQMEVTRRQTLKKWDRFVDDKGVRLVDNWAFFIGPLLTIPLIVAMLRFRDSGTGPLLALLGLSALLNLFQLVLYPYHLGPVAPVMFALVVVGFRDIWRIAARLWPAAALVLAALLPVALTAASFMKKEADALRLPLTYWERGTEPHGAVRADLQHWLAQRPQKQLVIVRYADNHSPNQEWVYNQASIDDSKVVWAREMGDEDNARLLDYFRDREAWLLEADVVPQRVVHYRLGIPSAPSGPAEICACAEQGP